MNISICIIAGDEQINIERCLKSCLWADELIVVDSYSKDKTFEIAKKYTDKVYKREWTGYRDQKNYVLSLAKGEWVLSIDADEEISDELQKEIISEINKQDTKDGYKIPRLSFYQGKWIKHSGFYPDYQLRLFKRKNAKWIGDRVHERIDINGDIGKLTNDIFHYPYKGSISGMDRTADEYSSLQANELYNQGKRYNIFLLIFRPAFKFFEIFFLKLGFLDGMPGFIIATISSYSMFLRYVKLRETENNNEGQ